MATINSILTNVNTVLDNKVGTGVILNSDAMLNFSYTVSATSKGDKQSHASITIESNNDSYVNFCDVTQFKTNLSNFIRSRFTDIGSEDDLRKTTEILIYRLILNYIINYSKIVVVPSGYMQDGEDTTDNINVTPNGRIEWYQKIILLNSGNVPIIDDVNNPKCDIVEVNVITHNNTGLLELCELGALTKYVDNLNIEVT